MRRSSGCAGKCPAMQAMSTPAAQAPVTLTIASVERDTGLSKDTLRVWERRYGFPAPGRDARGERLYPLDQVDKLRTLKRLLDLGHRPGDHLLHQVARGPSHLGLAVQRG